MSTLHDPIVGPCRPEPERRWTSETLPDLLERLWREGFTGPITFHFKSGTPRIADTSRRRIQIRLTTR